MDTIKKEMEQNAEKDARLAQKILDVCVGEDMDTIMSSLSLSLMTILVGTKPADWKAYIFAHREMLKTTEEMIQQSASPYH